MTGKPAFLPARWTAAAAIAAGAFVATPAAQAQEKVLRAVMHADVRTLDPFWTTQTIAGIHGMIVYDTLFGNDEDGRAQPQMVGKYDGQRGSQDLRLHAPRRPQVPRRQPGRDEGRGRLAAALGGARPRRAAPVLLHRQARGDRRQDASAWC